ncbi:MAG: DUF2975 domain-containing protein [Algicola sp.]|nr:DUF2975 domain-containing protein [Algicola sp.]
MSSSALSRISKVSKFVRWCLLFVGLLHVISFMFTLALAEPTADGYRLAMEVGNQTYTVNITSKDAKSPLGEALAAENFNILAILGSVDVVFTTVLYYFLFRLFSLYQRGSIFEDSNIQCFKLVGYSLMAWVVADLLYPVLVVLVIRFTGLSDVMPLFFGIGSEDLWRLLCGLMISVIGWIMAQARTLQQEQELTI